MSYGYLPSRRGGGGGADAAELLSLLLLVVVVVCLVYDYCYMTCHMATQGRGGGATNIQTTELRKPK